MHKNWKQQFSNRFVHILTAIKEHAPNLIKEVCQTYTKWNCIYFELLMLKAGNSEHLQFGATPKTCVCQLR